MKAVHFEVKFNSVKMKFNLKGHHVFLYLHLLQMNNANTLIIYVLGFRVLLIRRFMNTCHWCLCFKELVLRFISSTERKLNLEYFSVLTGNRRT